MTNVKATFFKGQAVDFSVILLLFLTLPLFFFKLGQSSLVSWDEAWYADIGKNILQSGDFLNLTSNGGPYLAHPPSGFWLISIGLQVFGMDEFGARAISAISGFGTLVIIYFLGKELFNRFVGVSSAIALASSFWFVYRARSGNLDVFLTMFFLLTLLLALVSVRFSKEKLGRWYLLSFFISLAFLFLMKTGVPFTIIPALLIIFWKSGFKRKDFILPGAVFLFFISVWFFSQVFKKSFFMHYFVTGLPGVKVQSNYLDNLTLIKTYLHDGIGKWFWPGILGVIAGPFLRKKSFVILTVFFLSFFTPFIFSTKGQIWHLVPLHPILILAFFGFFYEVLDLIIKKFFNINKLMLLPGVLIIIFSLYFSSLQINRMWSQFIDIPAFVSDEQILSMKAAKHSDQFFIDGEFFPVVNFYSGKTVEQISGKDKLVALFSELEKKKRGPFLLIIKETALTDIQPTLYKTLHKDRDKVLIRASNE